MTCGVITIGFEVGYPIRGHSYGSIQGSAEVDADGSVVSVCLEPLAVGSPFITLPVPFHRATPYLGDEAFAKVLAEEIEAKFSEDIAFKLMEWSVSIAEESWRQSEAAE